MTNDLRDNLPQRPYEHPDCPDCSLPPRLYESTDCWCIPLLQIDRLKKELENANAEIQRLSQIAKY